MGSVCSCFAVQDPGDTNEGCKCPDCFIIALFNKFAASFNEDQRLALSSANEGAVSSTCNVASDDAFSGPSDSPLLHNDGGDDISTGRVIELEKSTNKMESRRCGSGFSLTLSQDNVPESYEEEDVCPTCLEDYTTENPMIVTKCCHHFHLSCIYEWMERSPTCPICSKVMLFDETA